MLATLDALIDARRLKAYSIIFIGLYVSVAVLWWLRAVDGVDANGKPFGYDFITFYAAAKLALAGHAAEAFSPARIFAAEQAAVPGNQVLFLWHYPPTFHLMVAPLGLLGYLPAYGVFAAGTGALYLALIRHISRHPPSLLLACAFPPFFINLLHGQNGCLNTAVLGFGLLLLDRRPLLAGCLLGLLAYKPHLGLLLPFCLAAGGYWRAFAVAATTALAFTGLATLVFGPEYWSAFLANLALTREVLETGQLPWPKMPTVFAAASLLGASPKLAHGLQIATALPIAVMTVRVWRGGGPLDLKVALLVTAAATMSPYLFDYDLVLLAIPVAILVRRHLRLGQPSRHAAALVLISLPPLVAVAFVAQVHLQVMVVAVFALYALCWQALAEERGEAGGAALVPAPG